MTFRDKQSQYTCTGLLVNNVKQDGTPYFQTANHCISTNTVANSNGSDKLTKTDYINAGSILVKLSGLISDSVVCGCNLINFPLAASGATNYTFSIERPDKMSYTSKPDSIFLTLIPAEKKNGSFNSWIKEVRAQGTCSGSDSLKMKISMPVNDDIENAVRLKPGRNRAYSNYCASIEVGEPSPSSSTLKNTVWFTFQAPSGGVITIDTHGFNDQIAVYDAGSFA